MKLDWTPLDMFQQSIKQGCLILVESCVLALSEYVPLSSERYADIGQYGCPPSP